MFFDSASLPHLSWIALAVKISLVELFIVMAICAIIALVGHWVFLFIALCGNAQSSEASDH
jgi:hypothetical protein